LKIASAGGTSVLSLAWLFRTAPCRGAAEYTENAALRQAFCEDFFDFFWRIFCKLLKFPPLETTVCCTSWELSLISL